ncbi:MAG: membrane-bound lytic murein transglycosylase MltF [Nitrosomonadales bacterium]|nr:membrane-bound lytic murein transglycosylase MltF [Nitrosomonadales bacterium]
MWNPTRRLQVIIGSICLLLAGCSEQLPAWRDGRLLVIVPEASRGASAEFEREMALLFGQHLHTSVELTPVPPDNIDRSLRKHRAHLAAASLRSEVNIHSLYFGPSYQTVREQVVCSREDILPKKLTDLTKENLAVVAGSAQEVALREALEKSPSLQWQSRLNVTVRELLQEVSEGLLDCTVANELQLADARNYHSNLATAFDIGPPSKLAWAFSMDADPELVREVKVFFARIQKDGTLNRLLDRYYGHRSRLHSLDAAAFISRYETILPRYRHLFEEAAAVTGEDWRLLAALSYQESQWDPLATSFTNVRGMMMLTDATADQMKVRNRLDPRESIIAGAKYLVWLKEQMPARIPEPDRTWLALAAYNQGYGHLEDARVLTVRAGLNPDNWVDVKKWMPKLNQPGYYERLKYGYARGGEAVILVESIRSYYDILKRLESDQASDASESVSYRLIEPLRKLLD